MPKILHKKNNIANSTPPPTSIDYGEIAINYNSNNKKLFIKNDNNEIVSFRDEKYIENLILKYIATPPSDINFLELVYPIDSIYISVANTNPLILFGFGEWEQIKDTFLLAAGDTYNGGSIGGESEHTLTINELPSHGHDFPRHQLYPNENIPIIETVSDGYGVTNKSVDMYRDTTSYVGETQPHNNMPPYLTVYMWKRIG